MADAKRVIIDWLSAKGFGEGVVQYKLRDWLFSRQRYWGEPFPIVWDEHGPIALPDAQLPVVLPDVDDYSPKKTYDPRRRRHRAGAAAVAGRRMGRGRAGPGRRAAGLPS